MERRWDHEIPASTTSQLIRQEIGLQGQGISKQSQHGKKYVLFAIWCKQKQLVKAYWHGAIRVLWKGLCPKINGQSSYFSKQLIERLRA